MWAGEASSGDMATIKKPSGGAGGGLSIGIFQVSPGQTIAYTVAA